MQLISLKANKASFRPVIFKNKSGLNLIVAEQNTAQENYKVNSFNGVGKSLLLAIIHFCFGSSKKESFKKHLPDWEFQLEFQIGSEKFTSVRSTSKQNVIILNGEELKTTAFNEQLGKLLFDIPDRLSSLSFRSLLPFFYRPRRGSFLDFKNPNNLRVDYQILLANSFLLGLDVFLVKEKQELKAEKDRIKDLLGQLNSDPVLKEFFIGERDSELAIQDLVEKIEKLDKDLSTFNVADDYYEIKKEADESKRAITALQNEITLLQNQIINIQKSLETTPDLSKDKILKIYKEASISFNDSLHKTLDELNTFYYQITKNRTKRLSNQKQDIMRALESKNEELTKTHKIFDSKLQYLNSHQALDVFVQLTNKLSDLKSEKNQLENYQKLLKEYHTTKLTIDKKFLEATSNTEIYLNDIRDFIKGISDFFRALAKNFYPNSVAGITVSNNENENSIRFNLDARIESDSSDGISNVKIFCYDLTTLLLGQNHSMDSLFHDSRLLDGIDPRQIATLFRVCNQHITANGKQYIITLNQNHIDELKEQMSDEEFKNIILSNICHTIGDDKPENKLLGIQVDMKYDE